MQLLPTNTLPLSARFNSHKRLGVYPRTAPNASFAAATVRCTSSSVCAAPRNAASYCEGGRYTPLSSMLRKNFPKASVFDFDAESQSVTGPWLKNQVNIEPTRLWQSAPPASFAAAATPSTNSPLSFSNRGELVGGGADRKRTR